MTIVFTDMNKTMNPNHYYHYPSSRPHSLGDLDYVNNLSVFLTPDSNCTVHSNCTDLLSIFLYYFIIVHLYIRCQKMSLVYDYMTACFMFQQNLMILIVLEITANLIIIIKAILCLFT